MSATETDTADIAARLERLPLSRLHYKLLFIHSFGWFFDALDVGIVTFILLVLQADWRISSTTIGLIGSAGFAGMALGAAVSGMVADRLGRKAVFQITLLFFAVATLLCALAWNVPSLIAFRFLVGVGVGGELPVVSSLLSEFIPAGHRGRFLVIMESFWGYGWLLAAIIAKVLMPHWRAAFLVCAFPAFYIWVIRRGLPESPRWYQSRGRHAEADRVVRSLEAESERLTGHSLPEVHPISLAAETETPAHFEFAELWKPHYLRRTLMLWMLWFCLMFGFYGTMIWLPLLLKQSGHDIATSITFTIIITLAQIPGYFSTTYLVETLGRKFVITSCLALSALASFFFGLSTSDPSILLWGSIMSFAFMGAWGGVYAYTPELYPTRAGATGAGAAAVGRIGGILAPYIVGLLLPHIHTPGVMALNASFLILAALAVAILGEEPRGTLEQTSA